MIITAACEEILEALSNIDSQNHDNISTIVVSDLGYSKPPLEGESVNFSCPPELVLIGPNSTMCMGNGEWEPEPREMVCKGKPMHDHYIVPSAGFQNSSDSDYVYKGFGIYHYTCTVVNKNYI